MGEFFLQDLVPKSIVCVFWLGPDWYGIFGADADTAIREQENSDIQFIGWYMGIISAECSLTNTCDKDT